MLSFIAIILITTTIFITYSYNYHCYNTNNIKKINTIIINFQKCISLLSNYTLLILQLTSNKQDNSKCITIL